MTPLTGVTATPDFDAFNRIAVIGNYLPRSCGIATFTTDLCDALADEINHNGRQVSAVVMNDVKEGYDYPDRVRFQIDANAPLDYVRAADYLNDRQFDVVILQHEFGIFGGEEGALLLHLIGRLRCPLITTLHTVLKEPSTAQRALIRKIAQHSAYVTVMSRKAAALLQDVYEVEPEKVVFIHHGVPDVPFSKPDQFKERFGVAGRKVLLTFGLLNPNKGIESTIEALPQIIEHHPDVIYIVLGSTHPHVKRERGESYRIELQQLAASLGVESYVQFRNRFVELQTLVQYLSAADVYVTPYLSKEQIVSGTLAYALGVGVVTVSTPYWYAEELLQDSKGRLVPIHDPQALAREINDLLDHEEERLAIRKRCYQFSRPMVWKEVAREYLRIAAQLKRETLGQRELEPETFEEYLPQPSHRLVNRLPEVKLDHLRALTDSTGILQHATYNIPNRDEGYCSDDNARALIAAVQYDRLNKDKAILPEMHVYLSFLHHAFDEETGRFHNFMSYDRRWLDSMGSEDAHGRCLWALGETAKDAPNEQIRNVAVHLFSQAFPATERFEHPRSIAFSLIGAGKFLDAFDDNQEVIRITELLTNRLATLFYENSLMSWMWFEETLTYANGTLPHALLAAARVQGDKRLEEMGLHVLDWLLEKQTASEGHLSFVGNDGWLHRSGKSAQFDQQPIEAKALLLACAEAYRITADDEWLVAGERCLAWFLGRNDLKVSLYDFETGACCDGLMEDGLNSNQGAESTLSWLISLLTMCEIAAGRHVTKE